MYNKRKKKKSSKNSKAILLVTFIVLFFLSYLEVKNILNFNFFIRDLIYGKYNSIKSNDIMIILDENIKSSYEEMKNLVNIKNTLSDFDFIYASVIERDSNHFLESFTINKGAIDGVEVGDAGVDFSGLVGTVVNVNMLSSSVSLITNPSKFNNISVKIVGDEIVNKTLKVESGELLIDGINKNSKIKENDKVLTSGLSNLYPEGIIIGTIKNIKLDSYSVYKTASVNISSNIENLRYVAILRREK